MEIDQETLQHRLSSDQNVKLLDVRESFELERGILPHAIHIAMSQLQSRVSELSHQDHYVVYCEHGVRSLHVAAWLIEQGFKAESLAGGFAVWTGETEQFVEPLG